MNYFLNDTNLSPTFEWNEHHFFKINPPLPTVQTGLTDLILHNHYYQYLPMVWLAWAKLKPTKHATSSHNTKRSQHNKIQKTAVRQLLQQLIHHYHSDFNWDKNSIESTWLDESQYPYRLKPINYYISFSHSADTVCCAISPTPIGIDIELSDVPFSIAKRFYHNDESKWIRSLDEYDQQQASNLLWMLKEATIKRYSDAHIEANLIKGLKRNLSLPAQQLLLQSKRNYSANVDSQIGSSICHTSFTINPSDKIEEYLSPIHYVYFKSVNFVIAI